MYFQTFVILYSFLFSQVSTSPVKSNLRYIDASPWPSPGSCTGNCTNIHDPTIIRRPSDGTWFRLSTSGNVAIASAPDISGPWTYEGPMLLNGPAITVVDDQDVWAPNTVLVDGTYYTYYAVSKGGFQGSQIGVATSQTLASGSWTDHGTIGIPLSSQYNLIDPQLFIDEPAATPYFNFGSAWQGIFQTTLENTLLRADTEKSPLNLISNSTYPPGQTYPGIVEGSFLFKWHVNGQTCYYMFFSSGACCQSAGHLAAPGDEYKIMVCRSESVSGPFFDKAGKSCLTENGGTWIFGSQGMDVYAPGGQGVYYDSSLKNPILYYHYIKPTLENGEYAYDHFTFGFNYLDLSSGWPVLI